MKRTFLIGICLLLVCTPVQAETLYISDRKPITLRTGQGSERKIIAMMKPGQPVELLEAGEGWSKIRTADGKEGWSLTRFLTSKKPSDLVLKNLEKKHKELMGLSASIKKENAKLKTENQKLATELAGNKKMLDDTTKSYETLKAASADFIQLKSNHQETSVQLSEQTQKAEKLEKELLKKNIIWFLCGAAVLFVGFLMGIATKTKRKRSSLL
jgi:SH3 domain protein